MKIAFEPSQRSTVGVEWEIAMVERKTNELANVADSIISALERTNSEHYPHITTELMQNTLELVTSPHSKVADAIAQLGQLVEEVSAVTTPRGIGLMCAGSHPLSKWADQHITAGERYDKFIRRTQWWGRNMMIWGVHVHVGIDTQEKVFPILHALLSHYPHLQALSASSPFWAGEATGYASNRALMFQQLPTAGLPYDLDTWAEYESYIADLMSTGIISEVNEARWDIRPSPRWGTIELRYCDGLSTLQEIAAVTALSQCLTEHFSRELDAGRQLPRLQPWFVRENKWRAARYGLNAPIITAQDGTEQPVQVAIVEAVEMLQPVAKDLDCVEELNSVLTILEHRPSYERQLRVAERNHGDLGAVVESLMREFESGAATAK